MGKMALKMLPNKEDILNKVYNTTLWRVIFILISIRIEKKYFLKFKWYVGNSLH